MQLPTVLEYPIVAIGDLHGRRSWLESLVKKLRRHPVWPDARFVFLGDYVDRGDDVGGAIQLVIDLIQEKPGSTGVMGNHDLALVRAAGLDGPASPAWRKRYAEKYDFHQTFRSYLGRFPRTNFGDGWVEELALLVERMPRAHKDFLASLPWMAEGEGHVFVHCGLSPDLDEPANIQLELLRRKCWKGYVTPRIGTETHRQFNPEYPVWIGADKRLSENPLPVPGRLIVSGHRQVPKPDVNESRIRLDTSGGMNPPLTACILTSPSAPPEFVASE